MRILLIIINIYIWIIVAWALMTWIPGLSGSVIHNIIGLPVVPVISIFSFARIGVIGLDAMIVIGLLWLAASAIEKRLKEEQGITEDAENSEHAE